MTIDYANVTASYRRHKANVTRAENRKDYAKVVSECEAAFDDFDRYGWPDDWARFLRKAEDAASAAERALPWTADGLQRTAVADLRRRAAALAQR